jgi:tetratricopeptide (TPR) repeat protein
MEALKAEGNAHYSRGELAAAADCYQRALSSGGSSLSGSERATLHKNLAAVAVKQSQWRSAVEHCEAALSHCPTDVKALYRRALALEQLGQISAAAKDMLQAAQLQPKVRCRARSLG